MESRVAALEREREEMFDQIKALAH